MTAADFTPERIAELRAQADCLPRSPFQRSVVAMLDALEEQATDARDHVAYLEGELRKAHRMDATSDYVGKGEIFCEAPECDWEIPCPDGTDWDGGEVQSWHLAELLRWPR